MQSRTSGSSWKAKSCTPAYIWSSPAKPCASSWSVPADSRRMPTSFPRNSPGCSTRAMQQARIDEYLQSLSMRIQRNDLAAAPQQVSTAGASSAAIQISEQNLLASLRQIRATGRIVLPLRPDSGGVDSLPNIALEDGDRFVVPSVPAAVNVVGAVNDQNSFLFKPGSRAGAYLRLAGGPTRMPTAGANSSSAPTERW